MEPVTHALSGAVIACALPEKTRAWWFPLWAVLVAVSPDADIFFVHTPLQYIEYHRGITHSFAGGWALALGFALLLFLLNRTRRRLPGLVAQSADNGSLIGAWGLAYLIILHHIWLDCMNSYGTQVFLPFSEYRVRWNALFIVDPLLLVPLGFGLLCKHKSRPVMLALLLWTICYPLGALATRIGLESSLRAEHREGVEELHLVPDAFTPFHWKRILGRETQWDVAGYTVFRTAPQDSTSYAKPPRKLWRSLGEDDRTFRIYQRFALYPALDEVIRFAPSGSDPATQALNTVSGPTCTAHSLRAAAGTALQTGTLTALPFLTDATYADGQTAVPLTEIPSAGLVGEDEYVFSDLRFGSTIPFVDAIQVRRDGKPLTFRIMARILPDGTLTAVRFVTTKGAGGDSGWKPPFPD